MWVPAFRANVVMTTQPSSRRRLSEARGLVVRAEARGEMSTRDVAECSQISNHLCRTNKVNYSLRGAKSQRRGQSRLPCTATNCWAVPCTIMREKNWVVPTPVCTVPPSKKGPMYRCTAEKFLSGPVYWGLPFCDRKFQPARDGARPHTREARLQVGVPPPLDWA
jgi:hypothetical protein